VSSTAAARQAAASRRGRWNLIPIGGLLSWCGTYLKPVVASPWVRYR
jgi:hypothetical protein